MPRRSLLVSLGVLVACLAVLPGCKKKKVDDSGGDGGGGGGAGAAVSSDYVLFARLDAKSLRDGALFKEIKDAVAKSGGTADWDKTETEAGKEFGSKLTDIDTATMVVTEMPPRGEPKMVIIFTARAPFQKAGAFGTKADAKADSRGFYPGDNGRNLVHFPDDKTAVILSADLAQQYLDGYAKNRSGWPLTADLTRAAAGHTVFATVNVSKVPTDELVRGDAELLGSLASAKTVTFTADLKGKQLSAALRGTFPDAAAAEKAKAKVQEFVTKAASMVDQVAGGKLPPDAAAFMPAVKEAQRAIKEAKVETSGSDVTVTGSYKADFDIGQMVADAVKKWGDASGRMKASNNLKQIGLALHNYASVYGDRLLIHGTGANGAALKNATDKPLLSWRVAILPYIEQDNLYKQFKQDEPWDSATNKKLIEQMPKIFASVEKPGKAGYTHLQMVVGPTAMQPGVYTISNIPDGTSNTVAVIEAADPVIWTKPDDVMLPAKLAPGALKKKFGGQYPGGFNVLMWDGSVRFVKDTISERTLGFALNPNDGQVLGSDW